MIVAQREPLHAIGPQPRRQAIDQRLEFLGLSSGVRQQLARAAGQRHRFVELQLDRVNRREQRMALQAFAQQGHDLRCIARRRSEFDLQLSDIAARVAARGPAAAFLLQPQAQAARRQPLPRQPSGERLHQPLRGELKLRGIVGAVHQFERQRKTLGRLEPGAWVGRIAIGAIEREQQLAAAALVQPGARQRAHVDEVAAADRLQQFGETFGLLQCRECRQQRQRIEQAPQARQPQRPAGAIHS